MNRTVRQTPGEDTKEERERLWRVLEGEHGVRVPHLRGVPAAGRNVSRVFSFRELLRVRVCRRVGKTLGMFASELDVEPGFTQPPALRTCPSAIRHPPPRATVSSRGSIVDFPPGAMASSADRPSIDLADPNVSAEVAKKRRLMELAKRRDGTGSRRGNSPAPGNHVVKKWVVLDLGNRPSRQLTTPGARATTIASRSPGSVPTAPVRGT